MVVPATAVSAAPSPQPTAAQTRAASDLLSRIRTMTTTLDRLDAQYLRATQAAHSATTAARVAAGQLAATAGAYRDLRHQAQRLVIRAYVGSDIHAGALAQFMSPSAANVQQISRAYGAVVGEGLATKLSELEWLRNLRRTASEQAIANQATAASHRRVAAKALHQARAGEAELLVTLATIDGPTKAALAQLELAGDSGVARMLRAGSLGLPKGVVDPAGVLAGAQAALTFATDQIGKPYSWGAAGPAAFDCSGLVQQAWSAGGVTLPRVAKDQFAATTRISFTDLQPGDLVFFERDIGHVGIYVGNGIMIDAPHAGSLVQLDSIFWKDLAGFGRVTAP